MPRLDELVSPASIERAYPALASVAVDTPLLPALWLQEEIGAQVRLKCENLQRTGAFNSGGAYTMLSTEYRALNI